MNFMTAEELLAGSSIAHEVEVPASIISPGGAALAKEGMKVKLRPLTVRDVQRVTKAAKDSSSLISVLMLKEALVEPALTFEQVHSLHTGLARFLLDELNRVSGLAVDENDMANAVQAPLAKACFILAQQFGWSPQEVGELTMGQILLYLEMIRQHRVEAEGT